jgi:hypothetical protein
MLDISLYPMIVRNDLEEGARPLYTNKFASIQRVLVGKSMGRKWPLKISVRRKAISY